MSLPLVIALVLLAILMVLVLVVGRSPGGRRRPPGSISGMAERENAMHAQAEVEDADIEEMLAARDALRKRIGKPSLADELEADARRDLED